MRCPSSLFLLKSSCLQLSVLFVKGSSSNKVSLLYSEHKKSPMQNCPPPSGVVALFVADVLWPSRPCEIVWVVLPMSRDGVPTKSCWLFVADVAGCDVRRNRVACYARYFYFHDQE